MDAKVIQMTNLEPKRVDRREKRLRRLAMQIVVQLPEDDRDAAGVLRHVKALLRAS